VAETGDGRHGGDELLEARAAVETDLSLGARAREGAGRVGAGGRKPETAEVRVRDGPGAREGVRQPELQESRHGGAEPRDETAGDRVRGGDADLLPDDCPDSGLERIPGPWYPDAAVGPDDRADHVVAGEVPLGFGDVQVEAADAAPPLRAL